MKTAMEELIDYVKETWGWYEDFEIVSDKLLEKEKEQMIDFYNWMRRNDSAEEYFHYSDEDMLTEFLNQNK